MASPLLDYRLLRAAAVAAAGVLVGAGSFGRVFAGRLGSQEVAIKVLHHDDATALQVASEVRLHVFFCMCLPV